MATQKKSVSDSKDKPAAKRSSGVTFDVVPPGKVMPSATARPVITPTEPQQPDNTLTQPGSAPLIHKPITLQPSGKADSEAAVAASLPDHDADKAAADLGAALDELESAAPTAPEVPAVLGDDNSKPKPEAAKADKPAGRSVADLLSAKQAAAAAPEPAEAEENAKAETTEAPAEAEAKPEPEPEHKTSTHGLTIQPLSSGDKKPETDTEAAAAPTETAGPTDTAPASGTDAETRQDADTGTELADLNDKSKDKLTDEALPPAELYEGKPVIQIHEAHPVRSAVKAVLVFLFILSLALLAFNFLLDAGVVSLGVEIPHTDLLEP